MLIRFSKQQTSFRGSWLHAAFQSLRSELCPEQPEIQDPRMINWPIRMEYSVTQWNSRSWHVSHRTLHVARNGWKFSVCLFIPVCHIPSISLPSLRSTLPIFFYLLLLSLASPFARAGEFPPALNLLPCRRVFRLQWLTVRDLLWSPSQHFAFVCSSVFAGVSHWPFQASLGKFPSKPSFLLRKHELILTPAGEGKPKTCRTRKPAAVWNFIVVVVLLV